MALTPILVLVGHKETDPDLIPAERTLTNDLCVRCPVVVQIVDGRVDVIKDDANLLAS